MPSRGRAKSDEWWRIMLRLCQRIRTVGAPWWSKFQHIFVCINNTEFTKLYLLTAWNLLPRPTLLLYISLLESILKRLLTRIEMPTEKFPKRDSGSILKRRTTGLNAGFFFPFPKLVAIPRLKNTVCTTTYPHLAGGQLLHLYLFPRDIAQSYLPTPPLGQDMTQGQFFKRSLTRLNSEFSFS